MSSSKKRSTTCTTLPNGTHIRENAVEETHPDGSRTITITAVKTFKVTKTLPDGSKVSENVSTTTTTKKYCDAPVAPDLMRQAANAVSGFFWGDGGGNKAEQEEGEYEEYDLEDDDDEASKVSKLSKVSLARNQGGRMRRGEGLKGSSNSLSTTGGRGADSWTVNSANTRDLDGSYRQRRSEHRGGRQEERGRRDSRGGYVDRERPESRGYYTDRRAPTPTQLQHQQHEEQLYRQETEHAVKELYRQGTDHAVISRPVSRSQQQQQQQPSHRQSNGPAFFQKTNPRTRVYSGPSPSAIDDNLNADVDNFEDDGSTSTHTHMLYENDRCEAELPVFHKVSMPPVDPSIKKGRKPGGGLGRSIIRSLTPQRAASRDAASTSSSKQQRSISNQRSYGSGGGGSRAQRRSFGNQRTYSSSSGPNGVNRNIKIGINVRSGSNARQSQQPQRGRSGQARQLSELDRSLDPEVVDAIALIRERSKSPVRGGRRKSWSNRGGEQQQQQQPMLVDQRMAQQEAIAKRQLEQQQQGRAMHGQSAFAQDQRGYAGSPGAPPSPGLRQLPSPHQHDGPLQRMMSYSGRRGNHQASSPGGSPPVTIDGLPLGNLANPINWDDVSEARDDIPSVDGVRPQKATRPSPGNKKQIGGSSKKAGSKMKVMGTKKVPLAIPEATPVRRGQALLSRDANVSFAASPPKVAMHKSNAILTSDKFVHFFSRDAGSGAWVQTTTVSLPNTNGLSCALYNNTAVIGVPYDRNARGMATGSAYIFEKDAKTQTWYQVKKIVPKKVPEYATVGYSVDVCDNVVSVGVPEIGVSISGGNGASGGGSVYVYQRAEQFKWVPMGHLTMNSNNLDPNTLATAGGLLVPPTNNFGTVVALRHKVMVVSNYRPGREASLFVYEYEPSLKNKWKLIQTDLLSTEGQRRNFGSRIALTVDGEGIFIGCHSDVSPTEILFYKRKSQVDTYGNRSYQLQQIITLQERCEISDFRVDADDNFILGTLNSNRVYVYQQLHDLTTMESQGWRIVAKVVDDGSAPNGDRIERFGQQVGLHGDNIIVGTKDNVYAHSLEGWLAAAKSSRKKAPMARRLMSSMSPMRFRQSA